MKTVLKIFIGFILAAGLFTFTFYRTPQERAFTKNLALARNGDSQAALQVAKSYLYGQGVKPQPDQAIEWYQQASAAGNTQADWELYQLYSQGKQVPADAEAAYAYLLAAAQGGNPVAQGTLGNLYELGEGVPQHQAEALFWYLQAGTNGSAQAQAKADDISTENPALYEPVSHFLQTLQRARQPNAEAQLEVGQSYRYGNPVLQDDEAAFTWFTQAWNTSKETLSQAAFELSDQYAKGEGTPQDAVQAAHFLAIAAEQQNPSAQYQLGITAYTAEPAQLTDAFAWFSNAATQGHAQAQYMTGFMLLQGQGTEKSVPLAIRFFEQAAEQNDASAQYVLGQIYLKGLGIKADPSKGRLWLERAAENGNESARALLG